MGIFGIDSEKASEIEQNVLDITTTWRWISLAIVAFMQSAAKKLGVSLPPLPGTK